MDFGIQMYSLRDLTQNDLAAGIRTVAEQGYKLIEFAGFFDHSAEEIKAMLEENGVTVSGTHSRMSLLVDDFDGTVAFLKTIGCTEYIIPGHDLSDRAKMDEFIEQVNYFQPRLAAEGIRLSYHNHAHEYDNRFGDYVIYDELTEKTNINFEIDTYWAYVAGKDPVALMEEYKDRLVFIHIKDGSADGHGTPLGMGTAPVKAVFAKAVEMGIPMVVESETCTPSGADEAQICINYLRELEK